MELRQYGKLLLKWWWLVLVGPVLAGTVSYFVSKAQLPVYQATATIRVDEAQAGSGGADYQAILVSERLTRTYAELMRKSPLMDGVIQKLGLPYDSARLASMIQVQVIRDTQLLQVSVEHENPERARDIANAVVAVFTAQRLDESLGQTNSSREILRQQIADLEKDIKNTTQSLDAARAGATPQIGEITRLQTVLSQAQVTYAQLLKSEQDMRLAEARLFSSIKPVEPAALPVGPVRPKVMLNTLFAALAGLILALGAAFLIEYLDDTVKAASDVERSVSLPTIGTVARFPFDRTEVAKGPRLISEVAARSPIGEAYRILRANIDFAWAGEPGKAIMLTSAHSGEGKTTTIANLATVLARDNRSVIVVDADLRKPWLHRTFGVESRRGLSNLLADSNEQVADYLVATRQPNLTFLPSGPVPPNPSELLGSPRFQRVLDELKQLADIVLVDTPPVLVVVDPALIASRADGVVVIVDAGATRVQSLVRCVGVLARTETRLLGVVLNKLTRESDDYYYYYYDQHNRYYGSRAGTGSNGAEKQPQAVNT